MPDSINSQVAEKILKESLGLAKGKTVTVETWNAGLQFAKEVVRQARRMGCIPIMIFEDEGTYVDGVKNTPAQVLGLMGKHEYGLLAATDAYVFIPGPPLGVHYKAITRKEFSNATKYNSSWYDAAEKAKLKGVRLTFGYVGRDLAGFLGKTVSEVVDAHLRAALVDFRKVGSKARSLKGRFREGASVLVASEGKKLTFKLKGELQVEDGVVDSSDIASGENMQYIPPGFVLREVDAKSANGEVRFSPSLTRFGVVEEPHLEFERGRLVRWSSKASQQVLDRVLATVPEKNRVMSLFSIGLNDKLAYGFGQDRLVEGAIALAGFGFTGVLRNGSVTIGGRPAVTSGVLK